MNPASNNESGGMNLPPIMPSEHTARVAFGGPETAALRPELPSLPGTPAAGFAQAIPLPVPSAPVPGNPLAAVAPTTQSVVPGAADDGDLIEKEWVVKAKQIIQRTQDDPYQQSKAVNVFKADYMQKRYNKTIKLSE